MKYRATREDDLNLAWEMALAEAPYRDKHQQEKDLGKSVTYLSGIITVAHKAAAAAEVKYRQRVRNEAFANIVRNSDTFVIDKALFESHWGNGAKRVWALLQSKVREEPQIPLRFIPVVNEEFVLTGDLKTAAWGLMPNASGMILGNIVEYLETEEGSYLLKAQGLPTDYFSES